MLALWGALKSVVTAGDDVVSVCNGVYGSGVADMAASIGARVHRVNRLPGNFSIIFMVIMVIINILMMVMAIYLRVFLFIVLYLSFV